MKEDKVSESVEKKDYVAPKLQEHGNVEEVTLQTFFGTFSPPASIGN